MVRHRALLLAVIVLLAGCSAATGGPGSTPDADQPTASPTPADPVYDVPLDAETVAAAHNDSLEAAASFTVDTNVTAADDSTGEVLSVETTTAVDAGRGTMLMTGQSGALAGMSVYVGPDGSAYQRVELATGEPQYRALPTAPDAATFSDLPLAALVERATFTYAGRDRLDGIPVSVYEAVELEALVTPAGVPAVDSGEIRAFEARLAIDDDGLIRQFDYHVTVETDDGSRSVVMSIAFRDVGTTTVEAPGWVDEVG